MTNATRRAGAVLLALVVAALPACGPDSEEETLFVGPQRVPCVGVSPQTCYLTAPTADGPWTLFYSTIEGFAFEPGFLYELLVRVTDVPNPPMDASSLHYELVRVVSRTPAPTPR